MFTHNLLYIQNIFKINMIALYFIQSFYFTFISFRLQHFNQILKRLTRNSSIIHSLHLGLFLLHLFCHFFFHYILHFDVNYVFQNGLEFLQLGLSLTLNVRKVVDSINEPTKLFLYPLALLIHLNFKCDFAGLLWQDLVISPNDFIMFVKITCIQGIIFFELFYIGTHVDFQPINNLLSRQYLYQFLDGV